MSLCEPKNSQNFHHSPFNLVWVYILWLCVQFKESESFEFEQFSVPTEDTCHHFIADYKRKVHHCPKVSWNKDSWSKEQNFNFILTSINVNNLLINPHVHAILPVHATSCNPSVLFNLINPLFYGWTDRNDHLFPGHVIEKLYGERQLVCLSYLIMFISRLSSCEWTLKWWYLPLQLKNKEKQRPSLACLNEYYKYG